MWILKGDSSLKIKVLPEDFVVREKLKIEINRRANTKFIF